MEARVTTCDGAWGCLVLRFNKRPGQVRDQVGTLGSWGGRSHSGAWVKETPEQQRVFVRLLCNGIGRLHVKKGNRYQTRLALYFNKVFTLIGLHLAL